MSIEWALRAELDARADLIARAPRASASLAILAAKNQTSVACSRSRLIAIAT
jgi:hypothetical protein